MMAAEGQGPAPGAPAGPGALATPAAPGSVDTPAAPPRALAVTGLAAAVIAVLALQGVAIGRQALTSDEAYHALAGHQADRYGSNGLNLEHPPLVKLAAALPLLRGAPLATPIAVAQASQRQWDVYTVPGAEARVRWGGRLVTALLFGLPFLVSAYFLGRELGGAAAGWVLALLLGLDFSVFSLLPLIYTDAAEALAFNLTLLAAARLLRRPGLLPAALLGAAFGLAIAVKFTGLLLLPAVAGALLLAPGWRTAWRRRLLHGVVVIAVGWGLVELTYLLANRHYDAAYGRQTIQLYCSNHSTMRVGGLLQPYERLLLGIERRDPRATQWLTGLLATRAQDALGVFGACNFGHMTSKGHLWYFPVLLLAKTPLALLLASALALAAMAVRARAQAGDRARTSTTYPAAAAAATIRRRLLLLVALTAAVYLAAAAASNYNAGIRHILPVLALLYLPAALWAARRPPAAALLLAALLAESCALAPVWMSSANTWWLGARDPLHLAMSLDNAFYPQNLIALREVAARRQLRPLRVVDPALNGIEIDAYLGHGTAFTPPGRLEPGWYAVGASAEICIPAILRAAPDDLFAYRGLHAIADAWGPTAREVARRGQDLGFVASTFHLYRLPPGH
jgi:4-amino-4-deoxy-L-arabinose transferase-like glycosyltransferase